MIKRKWLKTVLLITVIATVFTIPMSVSAWKPAAHYVIAENLLAGNVIKQAMQAYPDIAAWGASDPDVPYADAFHAHMEGYISGELLRDAIAADD
jgi:hypothetical protein